MEQMLSEILRALPLPFAAISPEGRILFASHEMLRLPGRIPKASPPVDLADLLPKEVLEVMNLIECVQTALMSRRQIGPAEVRYRAPGVHRIYRWSLTPIQQASQAAALLVLEDITDAAGLRRTFQNLCELNEQVVASFPTAIGVFNAWARLELVNPPFAELIGLTPAACLGLELGQVPQLAQVIRAHDTSLADLMRETMGGAGPITWPNVLWPRKGAEGTWFDLMLLRIRQRGDEADGESGRLFLLMLTDVSDRQKALALQEQVHLSERLVAIGRMVAGVAHEINNPLCVISGNAQFLSSAFGALPFDGLRTEHWQEIVPCFEAIERESDRCCQLVASLLQHSRAAAPNGCVPEPIGLKQLIVAVLRSCGQTLARQEIRVDRRLDPRDPAVAGRPHELHQVLFNIITNAQQAMPDGGVLAIATGQDHEASWVSISDSGPGIGQECLERIFEPFFTTKPPGKGTGLGLFIANSIVTGLGGRIHVRSERGQGACLTVRLPRAGAPARAIQEV